MKINSSNLPDIATAAPADKVQKPSAEVWLNIGLTIPIAQADGTTVDTFIALPIGNPLDTMEDIEMRGSSADWANMVQAKNWLLGELQKSSENLAAGSAKMVQGLEIQMKRVGKLPVSFSGKNPLLATMASRLTIFK